MGNEIIEAEKAKEADLLQKRAIFESDTKKLGEYTVDFLSDFYPSYCITHDEIGNVNKEDSLKLLNSFTFYRLCECTVDSVDDCFPYFATQMQRLFTTAYSIKQEVCYGIVSRDGIASLLVGVAPTSDDVAIGRIIEGLMPGMKIKKYDRKFLNTKGVKIDNNEYDADRYVGCVSGVPALKVEGEYLRKDLSAMMRSLNGENYTIMVMCKPVDEYRIQEKIDQATKIKDECFAISKRTVSLQNGVSDSNMHSTNYSETDGEQINKTKGLSMSGGLPGVAGGAAVGAAAGSVLPGIGTAIGLIGGGIIGLVVGKNFNFNKSTSKGTSHSVTKGYSDAITKTISSNESISGDVQNGFAIELMQMAETMSERLKVGRSIGMWETVISFSTESELASRIIAGGLYNQVASGIPDILPPVVFSYKDSCIGTKGNVDHIHNQQLLIPEGFFSSSTTNSPLCSLVTSEELCGVCTIPVENTVGFEIKKAIGYSINSNMLDGEVAIGKVCEFERPLPNADFGLSEDDLNRHTFVCGITGSGKTNTVKHILESVNKPFLVIEPAKKEYRNIQKQVNVYTLGRPEINCLKINPFYILPGISPQQHIDLLKDLFCASFAFYGPMPYILEKCLYNIYSKKGWNLTLGFHPCLVSDKKGGNLFSEDDIRSKYKLLGHRYLFPTMQDLKDEVDYYIEHELSYEGEVKGNIRGAIKARIDSLCVGAKGYMFNTYNVTNFDSLFTENTVLELEGLADDADKAFALGLLIIYVNEYRQVKKEVGAVCGLEHVLVIEEAHRLLTNVATGHSDEVGNPKGKAVEHFTNMLAEMRSYGQGVIVAEQIPSKLATDVIKNSSNKIVHRIVAIDDQEAVANTIGIIPEDAIYLGNQRVGYALCHKEGMVKPVSVKVQEITKKSISDTQLYEKDIETKLCEINKSTITNQLPKEVNAWAVKTLVSLMYKPEKDKIFNGIELAVERIEKLISLKAMTLIPGVNKKDCIVSCINDAVIALLISGVFSNHSMPSDELVKLLADTIKVPNDDRIKKLTQELEKFYKKNPSVRASEIVAALVSEEYALGCNVSKLTNDFLFYDNPEFILDIKKQFS